MPPQIENILALTDNKSAVIGTIIAIKLKNLIEVIRFLQPLYPGVIFWFVCGQGVKDLSIKSNIYNGGKERSEEFRKKKKKNQETSWTLVVFPLVKLLNSGKNWSLDLT